METLENAILFIITLILGGLATLGIINLKKKKEDVTDKDYSEMKENKEDELKEKPASDIVDSLDNADDIRTIESRTDEEFRIAKDRKRKSLLDRFRSGRLGE